MMASKDKSLVACEKYRRDFLDCLINSDCVRKEGFTPRECIEGKIKVRDPPIECNVWREKIYQCKRSQIDMRSRFRGKRDYVES